MDNETWFHAGSTNYTKSDCQWAASLLGMIKGLTHVQPSRLLCTHRDTCDRQSAYYCDAQHCPARAEENGFGSRKQRQCACTFASSKHFTWILNWKRMGFQSQRWMRRSFRGDLRPKTNFSTAYPLISPLFSRTIILALTWLYTFHLSGHFHL